MILYLLALSVLRNTEGRFWSSLAVELVKVGGIAFLSSVVSDRLPTPMEALPTDIFLLWQSSVRLDEHERLVL